MANAATKKTTKETTREEITLGQLLQIYAPDPDEEPETYIQLVTPDEEEWDFATEIWVGSKSILKPWLDYPIIEMSTERCYHHSDKSAIRVGLGEKTDKG